MTQMLFIKIIIPAVCGLCTDIRIRIKQLRIMIKKSYHFLVAQKTRIQNDTKESLIGKNYLRLNLSR